MIRSFVESSIVEWVGYDEAESKLTVAYNSGKKIEYQQVPKEEYEALMNAKSKGRYMRYSIIGLYPEVRIR